MLKHKQHQTIVLTGTAVALGLAGIVGTTIPAQATGSEVKIDVNVRDTVSLAIYPHGDHTTEIDQLSLQDAIPGGDMVHNSLDLVVRTNVTTGYQLTMRDTDTDTDLAQVDGAGKIPTLESSVLATEFPSSRWGYAVGEYSDTLEFSGIPSATAETAALISKSISSLPNEGETTTVTFGARIGAELEPGQYEGSVMFTVVPELMPEPEPEPEKPAFFTIENMQDMTADVCASATTPTAEATLLDTDGTHAEDTNYVPRTTLTDTRDSKTYTVSKLADGNCWMSQDLNYVLSTSEPLTSEKSDLPEGTSWTPENDTQTSDGIEWNISSAATARSYTNGQRTLYNWKSAMGGSEASSSLVAHKSVCPRGWKISAGGYKGEYYNLFKAYGIKSDADGTTRIKKAPLNFNNTGRYSSSSFNTTYTGFYWETGSSASGGVTYLMTFMSVGSTNEVSASSSGSQRDGYAVRCLAR